MFRYRINIDKNCDIESVIQAFLFSLSKSGLPVENTAFLSDIVCETARQLYKHILSPNIRYSANRAFEGNGYCITITARSVKDNFILKILRLLGIGK